MVERNSDSNDHSKYLIASLKLLGIREASILAIRLTDFISLLEDWNKRFNLISKRTLVVHHILDVMIVGPALKIFSNTLEKTSLRILDIGSGSGVVGIVLCLMLKNHYFFSSEISEAKNQFQQLVKSTLNLTNYSILNNELNLAASNRFDLIISRAFVSLRKLSVVLQIRSCPMLIMKGSYPYAELKDLKKKKALTFIALIKNKVLSLNKRRCLVLFKPNSLECGAIVQPTFCCAFF